MDYRTVDMAALLVGFVLLAATVVDGIRSWDVRRDGLIPVLAFLLVMLLAFRMQLVVFSERFLGPLLFAGLAMAGALRFIPKRSGIKSDLEAERAYYESSARQLLCAERADGQLPDRPAVAAAVEDKLYEELTAIDQKLAFTLAAAGSVVAIHGFFARGLIFPAAKLAPASPDALTTALIASAIGLFLGLAAAFLALWPRAIWLGEERLRLIKRDEAYGDAALERRLIQQRRTRDRSYTAAKRLTLFSAFSLIIAHFAASQGLVEM